jgi:hypothetical protein
MTPIVIHEDELTRRARLGEGGSATIYDVSEFEGSLTYKKYRRPRSAAGIERVIRIARQASGGDSAFIEAHFAWPVAAVISADGELADGELVGVLIPKAPSIYWVHLTTGVDRVRDLNYLFYETRSAKVGVTPVDGRDKLRIIRGLAEAFIFLKRYGLVHEDPSAQNVLWSIDPEPTVYLLDCDSLREEISAPDEPLVTTLDWTDPRILDGEIARPDYQSAVYVLALTVARAFGSPSWRPPVTEKPDTALSDLQVPPQLREIVKQSIVSRGSRPSLELWLKVLNAAIESFDRVTSPRPQEPKPLPQPRLGGLSYRSKEQIATIIGFLVGGISALLLMVFVL